MRTQRPDVLFPIGALATSPALAMADATALGAVTAILTAWWASGCAPLPDDASGLTALARCSAWQWRRVKTVVRAALGELLPGLASEYSRGRRAAVKRSASAAHAAKVRHSRTVRGAVRPVAEMPISPPPAVSPGLSWGQMTEAASRARQQAASATLEKNGQRRSGLIDVAQR